MKLLLLLLGVGVALIFLGLFTLVCLAIWEERDAGS